MSLGDFSQQAAAYDHARPSYPETLFRRLLDHAGVRPGDPVVDLGAGTGIFTRLLSATRLRTTAIEPNEAMSTLAPELEGVLWRKGTFEETGLEDASQRWVVAAQAFHWADPARALPEIRRILASKGTFTVIWNDRDHKASEVLTWMRAAILRHVPGFDEAYRAVDWTAVLSSTGDFTEVVPDEEPHVVSMSRKRFLSLWRSHNRLTTTAGPKRMEALLAELAGFISTQPEPIVIPYRCRAWTARRV